MKTKTLIIIAGGVLLLLYLYQNAAAMAYTAAGNAMYNNVYANPSYNPFYWAIAAGAYGP